MTINYDNRLTTLQNYLKDQGIDAAIVTDPANVFYYTGFDSDPHERFLALVLDIRSQIFSLFIPALDKEIAENESHIKRIVSIADKEDPFSKLQTELGSKLQQVDVEMKTVSMYRHQQLQAVFLDAVYTDIKSAINKQRFKKSRNEIDYLQEAVTIIENVLSERIKKVKIGMTEAKLTAELEFLMKRFDAAGPSFSTIVLAGEETALPHGKPGVRAFKNGDFLLIDFGVVTNAGHCSDITRTFIIGEATDEQRKIYDII